MQSISLITTFLVLLAGMPASAQIASEGARFRIARTIGELKGDVLTINTPNGQKQSVTLSPNLQVYGVENRRVADIKPGDFVASKYSISDILPENGCCVA